MAATPNVLLWRFTGATGWAFTIFVLH